MNTSYHIACHDHVARITRTTEVASLSEAKRLAWKATHAVRVLGYGRKATKPLPHREVRVTDETGVVLLHCVGNTAVITPEQRAAALAGLDLPSPAPSLAEELGI